MSILPGTLCSEALGNTGMCSLVSSDGCEGSLHSNQLQAAIHEATGLTVQADKGPGLHSAFNSSGVGMEQPAVQAPQQPEVRPDPAVNQTMNFNG